MLAAACSSSGDASQAGKSANAPDAAAAITPASGASKVRPDKGVTVTADSGVLEQVSVQAGQSTVDGVLAADKKSWKTKWALKPGTAYTVTATAKNAAGKVATVTSKFTTLKASSTVKVSDVTPSAGETVGVGMPITVSFDRAITDRAAVEKALEVRSTSPMEGAWRWITNQQVIFRTKAYWPAHSKVSLVAHLSGVRAASGVYGTKDVTKNFSIGASHIAKVNLKTHKSKVYVDGKLAKTIPVSGGMGGADSHGNDFRTTSGVHLAMGKSPVVTMTSPNIKEGEPGYYHELVYKDVQISNSGEYLHQSPGEYGCLGHSNCSHGCVRQTPAGAQWFFKLSNRGDVVVISGTTRDLEWNNGWGYWQLSFTKWMKEGALKQPVTTTPLTATAGSGTGTPAHN
ncbi:Ig-like domain-containing protein [Actinoallomurus purpureus]|uniref:L,D-transpeptidase n=1 Tax=Actinoallomurus purpureus TaxID=478114 RepID=UPI002092C275|nr:Ig-like domain-containing protein [Actinoallomurus purpureus]MCO6010428.1 Ig-like domain-containing protein [Actinoallomurus purpureus]